MQQPASLSIDLDDHWAYLRTAGDERWRDYPTFLPAALERVADVLNGHGVRLTAFVIGEDAEMARNAGLFGGLSKQGHELANHSYAHDAGYAHGSRAALEEDLLRAETAIERLSGTRPVGYRGPSFSYSPLLLSVLAERGYDYDASTFPTFLGPLARLYLRLVSASRVSGAETGSLFGDLAEGFRPLRPYAWRLDDASLLEIPNTTFPLLRLPIHGTYLHFLADRSEPLALWYFRTALAMCRLTGAPPSFLLHATDFLGHDDFENYSGIPGMGRTGSRKTAFMRRVIGLFAQRFEVMPMGEFARTWRRAHVLPVRNP